MQQKRIDLAITLLENANHSISEICFLAGYEDVSSFTGMKPSEIRRQIKS
ncbi:helix-turn-helix domain-containing protein [Rapidithrix thailandica]